MDYAEFLEFLYAVAAPRIELLHGETSRQRLKSDSSHVRDLDRRFQVDKSGKSLIDTHINASGTLNMRQGTIGRGL